MAEKKGKIAEQVSVHAWNKDGTMLAISANNAEVLVYGTEGKEEASSWTLLATLREHGGYVSGMDWCGETDQLVTCGHDRNAYVWSHSNGGREWKPTLVICRINRAATSVRWSPSGKKFAVTSGAKCVPVCQYEESSDWWISKMIKKHKSSVTSVAWSPNSRYVVTGSTDNKCRVFSALLKGIDDDADDGIFAASRFGDVLAEFDMAKSWVNDVAWSPSGSTIAFAAHGSSVVFVDLNKGGAGEHATQFLRIDGLPYATIDFVDDGRLVAAGWSCNPAVIAKSGDSWAFQENVDKEVVVAAKVTSKFAGARGIFQAATDKGHGIDNSGDSKVVETKLKTKHQNTIVSLVNLGGGRFSTAAIDGNVFFWQI